MLIIAHHSIFDPQVFWATAQQTVATIPPHLKLHSVFPSKDLKTGTCLWEGPSVEEVQEFLDNTLRHFSKNVCYEVNEEFATGLPRKTEVEALSS
jgi:hypothetical protein